MNRDGVRMATRRRHASFPHEAQRRPLPVGGAVAPDDFDGDFPEQSGVVCTIHLAQPTEANALLDDVPLECRARNEHKARLTENENRPRLVAGRIGPGQSQRAPPHEEPRTTRPEAACV